MTPESEMHNGAITPCRQTRRWLAAVADGQVHGLIGWYMKLHLGQCVQCAAALKAIVELRERLRGLSKG